MRSLQTARLVRVHDRLTLSDPAVRDQQVVWSINPRTGSLETRAGLSWTGVREYRTPQGIVRVLRRPEQVNAPAHLRTLRLLPVTDGHPDDNVDVSPANEAVLRIGSTGDLITVEELGGYSRPVGNISVSRPSAIAKMVDRETWDELCKTYDLGGAVHPGGPPCTGTSLGYNALWVGPHTESEIKGERDDGEGLLGEWQGPHGPEEYDVEHVVDAQCGLVQSLARTADFDPAQLGANHFAAVLPALTGRGGEQSECMRIVDSRDVLTVVRPLQIQVPRSEHREGGTTPPPTDPPISDRAHDVTDPNNDTEREAEASRDSEEPTMAVKTTNIEIGLGRDAYQRLVKSGLLARLADKGIALPQTLIVPVPVTDEIDGKALLEKLAEMKSLMGDLIEMVGAAYSEVDEAEKTMEDMAPKEEMEAAIKDKEKEIAEMKDAYAKMQDKEKALMGERDSLLAEVEPLRAKELTELRTVAVQLGCDEAAVKAAKDSADVRRLVAATKLGERYAARDEAAKTYRVSDDVVSGVYEGLVAGLAVQQTNDSNAREYTRDHDAPFNAFPPITSHTQSSTPNRSRDATDQVDAFTAGLLAAGG